MAVAIILDFPGGTLEQYDAVMERMALGDKLPEGGQHHVVGKTQDGLRVVDCWDDMEVFGRFADAKIKPMTAEVGMAEPRIRTMEVHSEPRGHGGKPVFLQIVTLPGLDAAAFQAEDDRVIGPEGPPRELTWHVNGQVPTGWCVIDTWSSKDARDRFLAERVVPVMEKAPMTGPPMIEELEVYNSLVPSKTPTL